MKWKLKKDKKSVISIIVFVILTSLLLFLLNENKVKYHAFQAHSEMNEESEKIYEEIEKLVSYKRMESEFFGAPNIYYILEKNEEYTTVVINTFQRYKKIKSVKNTKEGIEIKIKEKQYKNAWEKFKMKRSSTNTMPSVRDLIVRIEGKHDSIKIITNIKESELEILDLTKK